MHKTAYVKRYSVFGGGIYLPIKHEFEILEIIGIRRAPCMPDTIFQTML